VIEKTFFGAGEGADVGVEFSIRVVNIPWIKFDPGVNLPWGSKYHMTPVYLDQRL
jgi:hypothetical protein